MSHTRNEDHAAAARSAKIRALNDQLRMTFQGGLVVATDGVQTLPHEVQVEALHKIRTFTAFNASNDPCGEHDCVRIEHAGKTFFAKIDYYDRDRTYHSEDPADPDKTCRVMTIMLAEEY